MSKRISSIFFGFIVAAFLIWVPIPDYKLWSGVTEHIENIIRVLGYVFFGVFGFIVLSDAIKALFHKEK